MNKIAVSGRLASDVTTKEVNGRTVANFRLASQNKKKGTDGQYGTNFYSVEAWASQADIASKYLKKGHRTNIAGDLVIRTYTGSDGQKYTAVEIQATDIDLVETKAEAEAKEKSAAPAQTEAAPQGFTQVETDELPF